MPDEAAVVTRVDVREVGTPGGPARLSVHTPDDPDSPDGAADRPRGTLALGHGAGGGVGSADLVAVTAAAVAAGWRVVLVEQPWLLAGRRVAVAPPRLDEAWLAALAELAGPPGPLVLGGRSAGARVACRTASALGAAAVVALAFPLHPPGRPERSRAGELAAAGVPLLVVQGERDAFGGPQHVRDALADQRVADAEVAAVPGDHALRRDPAAVAAAVVAFLRRTAGH